MLLLPSFAYAQSVVNDGAFVYVKVTGSPGSPPARYTAPLPGTLATWAEWSEDVAPVGIVRFELCVGDPARWDAFVDAADRAIAAGDPRDQVIATYANLLVCEPTVCGPARTAWATGGTRAALAIHALVECPNVEDIFASPAVPEGPWLDYWEDQGQAPKAVRRRAAAAVASALADGDAERLQSLVYLAGERDDSEVARLLLAAVGSAKNEEDRRVVLQGLYEQSDREAKRLFAAFCKTDEEAWGCPSPDGAAAVGIAGPPPPPDFVRSLPTGVAVDRLPGDPADVGVHATRLAWAGGLRGVRFEHNGSTLTAWMDGQAYTVVVYHVGPGGDLPRVLGLLNALARTRGEQERWVAIRGGVAIGPGPVLEKAIADKVLLR